jgi:hypothetical protein
VTEQVLGKIMGQGGSSEEGQADNSPDVNLEELAELIFKKLHEELLLENERTGRTIPGR